MTTMSRKALLVTTLGSLLLAVAWFFLIWGPTKDSYGSANKELSQLKTKEAALRDKVARLSKLDASKLQQQVDDLSLSIPKSPDLDVFLHQLQDQASASGVTLTSVAPSLPTAGSTGGVSEIKVTMSLTGSYQQVSKFLDGLDGMPRLVVTDSIQFTVSPSSASSLTAQLSSRIFTTATVVDSKAATGTGAVQK